MVQRRPITDVEREDALAWINSWDRMRESSTKAFVFDFVAGTFAIGVLAIGVVHFLFGWFLAITFPIKAGIVVGTALIGGLLGGIDAARRATQTRAALNDQRQLVESAVEQGTVLVYFSASVKAYFDEDANPEHPPLLIEFGESEKLSLEAMEQDQFGIWKEISGECEIVTLFEKGPILSVKTSSTIKHLREAFNTTE